MEQKWTIKKAQDLQKGDLISGPSGNFALEVISVEVEGEKVFVRHYSDTYRLHSKTYEMQRDQQIPTAAEGVKHMDIITSHQLG